MSRSRYGNGSASDEVIAMSWPIDGNLRLRLRVGVAVVSWCFWSSLAGAANEVAGGGEAADPELAKASQNPAASLVSVPLQLNFNGGIGPNDRVQLVANLQPIIPLPLSRHWSVVTRWILPFVAQPNAASPDGTTFGLGDLNPQLFVAVELPHDVTLAPGVNVVLPTATDTRLGNGKLSFGPALVVVWSPKTLVVGLLFTSDWSVAGRAMQPAVDELRLQPFINVNLPKGVFLVTSPPIAGDWHGRSWTVPVGGGVGRVMKIGLPVNLSVQAYANVVAPAGGSTWLVRTSVQLLFPQKVK